jgi:hypothetical protein
VEIARAVACAAGLTLVGLVTSCGDEPEPLRGPIVVNASRIAGGEEQLTKAQRDKGAVSRAGPAQLPPGHSVVLVRECPRGYEAAENSVTHPEGVEVEEVFRRVEKRRAVARDVTNDRDEDMAATFRLLCTPRPKKGPPPKPPETIRIDGPGVPSAMAIARCLRARGIDARRSGISFGTYDETYEGDTVEVSPQSEQTASLVLFDDPAVAQRAARLLEGPPERLSQKVLVTRPATPVPGTDGKEIRLPPPLSRFPGIKAIRACVDANDD